MMNCESHLLKPFFNIIEESNTDMARAALKIIMKKKELDADLLDFPKGILPEQTGVVFLSLSNTSVQCNPANATHNTPIHHYS